MDAFRNSVAALPAGPALTWARAEDESADELCDWMLNAGPGGAYRVHTAIVASGARGSNQIRLDAIAATKGSGTRSTDILSLIKSDATRGAIQNDPHFGPTVEMMLNWMYTPSHEFLLPSLGGVPSPSTRPVAIERDETNVATREEGGVLDMFSTAIFGTPSKHSPRARTAAAAPPGATGVASTGDQTLAVQPEQVVLLWQLGDSLGVRGLKARLAPIVEHHALPPKFVMNLAAFERLKLLVRALALHVGDSLVGALCEQLKLNPATADTLREGMVELAVAASAVDTSRYPEIVALGLLPQGALPVEGASLTTCMLPPTPPRHVGTA